MFHPRLPFFPSFSTEHYYTALIFLSPPVLIAEMLLQVAFVHVGLRLAGFPGDFDQLLNVVGMAALITFFALLRIFRAPAWLGAPADVFGLPAWDAARYYVHEIAGMNKKLDDLSGGAEG